MCTFTGYITSAVQANHYNKHRQVERGSEKRISVKIYNGFMNNALECECRQSLGLFFFALHTFCIQVKTDVPKTRAKSWSFALGYHILAEY